jgi:hypothetical protein
MTDARSPDELRHAARRHWRQVALSTTPIDKARAAAAVEAVYTAAIGRPPAHILFFDSPLQAEIAGTFFAFDYPDRLPGRDRGRPRIAQIVREGIRIASVGAQRQDAADDVPQLEHPIRAALTAAYHVGPDRIAIMRAFDALCGQLAPQVLHFRVAPGPRYKGWLRRVKRSSERSVSQRQWIAWAADLSVRSAAFPERRMIGDRRLISAVVDVARECGWCWFYPDFAILADRPTSLRLDATGRLHAEDGPALAYRDGFSIHALHGVRVERWMIERPARITPADVEREPNAEVRRALVERMGHQRYLSLSGAVVVARDETGTLWRRHLPGPSTEGRRAWCFVEVVNGTREPDGTHKHYFLRVPPTMRAAREAVAWTYGLSAEAYQPRIRT